MAHKYQLPNAIDAALAYLQSYYPAILTDTEYVRAGPPNFTELDHIGVVNLARLTDRANLLPVAFMHCCALDPKALIRGFEREDGNIETLSPDDLHTVLIARAELIKADARDCLAVLDLSDNCENEHGCREMFVAILTESIGAQERYRFSAGWREPWKPFLENIGMVPCQACVETIEEQEQEKLAELYERWPRIVGLQ